MKKHIVPLMLIFIYLLPYLIYGENAYVLIHDNLDSSQLWYKVLAESGKILAPNNTLISNIPGLTRASFASEFSVMLWLHYFFKPFTAYVINQVLIRVFAYLGMYLLLRKFKQEELVSVGVALVFSLLPFLPYSGLSVAGLPLALFAFLNIREGVANKKDWLILLLLPFYSLFVFSFIFFLFFMGLLWLRDVVNTKRPNFKFLLSILSMTFIYMIVEYRLFYSIIFPGFVAHRVEFKKWTFIGTDMIGSLQSSWNIFLKGHYHAASLPQILIFTGVCAIIVALIRREKIRNILGLLLLNAIISLFYGIWTYWNGVSFIKEKVAILNSFDITRFTWLMPLFWYILFAIALGVLFKTRYGTYIVTVLLVFQVGFLFYSSDYFTEKRLDHPTYQQFFAESMFKEIEQYIGKDKDSYNVINIGIHPSVAEYNGFHTLDFYSNNYPLDYKHRFRHIIEKELAKSEELRLYYDNWGSRVYTFAVELNLGRKFYYCKWENPKVKNLELNIVALKQMGGKYVFSTAEILNVRKDKLELLKIFESDIWKIYLYEVL